MSLDPASLASGAKGGGPAGDVVSWAVGRKLGGGTPVPPTELPYLTFYSPNDALGGSFTLEMKDETWDGTLQYSTNAVDWSYLQAEEPVSSALSGSRHVLYLRGHKNTWITGWYEEEGFKITTDKLVYCEGDIRTLLEYEDPAGAELDGVYCFANLFKDCSHLVSAPALPSTKLSEGCYYGMFKNCSALLHPPELPATELVSYCYCQMFENCDWLMELPDIPAEGIEKNSCLAMFANCQRVWVSTTQTGEYTKPFRIPPTGTAVDDGNSMTNMFVGTSGTFTGTPSANTTYYVKPITMD